MFSNDRGHADQPLVSVIMIFFNAERFIDEAIASVLSQTYERWELLLVDDGSTDGSTEIACSHAAQRPEQIHVLEHPGRANRGTGPSRNLGIAHTRGDYIAFLDADDVWEPNALASLVALAVRQPAAGLIYGPTLKWFGWTGRRKDRRRDELDIAPGRGIVPNQLVEPPDVLTCFLNDSGTVPCMCSLLARRDQVERVGGFDTAFDGVYEDQAFYAKLALVAPVYVTGGCWARYRQHADSMCAVSQKAGQERAARLHFLIWLSRYMTTNRVTDAALWSALERAMQPYFHPLRHVARETARRLPKRTIRLSRRAARKVVPPSMRRRLRTLRDGGNGHVPVGDVRFGTLRRLTPVSLSFGFDRGLPIDRYYIERFLSRHVDDVRGRLLEIGDATYTRKFGGSRVDQSDVLHVHDGNPHATVVGDLATADHISSDTFDCIILTQTLHLIYELPAAVRTIQRILKPGGVVLATVPGISQISNDEWNQN
ncbi:MAG: glycosyltransferase, partial [Nitrolancea sp.]